MVTRLARAANELPDHDHSLMHTDFASGADTDNLSIAATGNGLPGQARQ
jgi:hypothetical protein